MKKIENFFFDRKIFFDFFFENSWIFSKFRFFENFDFSIFQNFDFSKKNQKFSKNIFIFLWWFFCQDKRFVNPYSFRMPGEVASSQLLAPRLSDGPVGLPTNLPDSRPKTNSSHIRCQNDGILLVFPWKSGFLKILVISCGAKLWGIDPRNKLFSWVTKKCRKPIFEFGSHFFCSFHAKTHHLEEIPGFHPKSKGIRWKSMKIQEKSWFFTEK